MSALSRGLVKTFSGTVGTSPVVVLQQDSQRQFFQIQLTDANNTLAYTVDGSTPAINGTGKTLTSLASETRSVYVPTGAITVIGSGSNTAFYIEWA